MKFNKLIVQIEKINGDLQLKALTIRNWMIGHHIYEYEQGGQDRAKYGENFFTISLKNFPKKASKEWGLEV